MNNNYLNWKVNVLQSSIDVFHKMSIMIFEWNYRVKMNEYEFFVFLHSFSFSFLQDQMHIEVCSFLTSKKYFELPTFRVRSPDRYTYPYLMHTILFGFFLETLGEFCQYFLSCHSTRYVFSRCRCYYACRLEVSFFFLFSWKMFYHRYYLIRFRFDDSDIQRREKPASSESSMPASATTNNNGVGQTSKNSASSLRQRVRFKVHDGECQHGHSHLHSHHEQHTWISYLVSFCRTIELFSCFFFSMLWFI